MSDLEPWLSVKEASLLFSRLELPRNERSVRRYCKNGKLDCRDIENDNRQFEHRVRTASVVEFIDEQKTLLVTSGHDRATPESAGHDRASNEGSTDDHGQADMSGHDRETERPRLSEVIEHDLRERVQELKDQMAKKDDQIATQNQTIASMLERDRETNVLVKGLQELLSAKQLGTGQGTPTPQSEPPAQDAQQHETPEGEHHQEGG